MRVPVENSEWSKATTQGIVSVDEFLFEDDEARPTVRFLVVSVARLSSGPVSDVAHSRQMWVTRRRRLCLSRRMECVQIDDLVDEGLMSRNYCTTCM